MNLKYITPKDFFDTLSVPARNITFWRRVILHLSLLRHAAKCKQEEEHGEEGTRTTSSSPPSSSPCCTTPRCQETKKLWNHVEACKNPKCKYPFCTSSRIILSHHYLCQKDPTRDGCPCRGPWSRQICQPVRISSTLSCSETAVERSTEEAQSRLLL